MSIWVPHRYVGIRGPHRPVGIKGPHRRVGIREWIGGEMGGIGGVGRRWVPHRHVGIRGDLLSTLDICRGRLISAEASLGGMGGLVRFLVRL